eukprot:275093_1
MGTTVCNVVCCCGCKYCCASCCDKYRDPPPDALDMTQFEKDWQNWKTGDIIVERGKDTFNNAFVKASDILPWTHCGLVYVDEKNVVNIVEITWQYQFNISPIGPHFLKFMKPEDNVYFGHRSIDKELTNEEKEKFKKGIEALKDKKYDESIAQFGSGCDCCDCLPCCGEDCCGLGTQSKQERLEALFCSELVAEILQRVGIAKTDLVSDEFTPGDFHQGNEFKWINDGFSYGKVTVYAPLSGRTKTDENVSLL